MKRPRLTWHVSADAFLTGALAFALFGVVLGAKLIYVNIGGSDLPNWDQWDAEALNLLQPWFEGRFHWIDLFQSHNEHRVALTKLLGLAEVGVNGQWDARLQCVVNAIMHAGLVAGAWLWMRRLVVPIWARMALFVALVALTAAPISWQNLLGGFHSQQVFLLGLSLAALALMLDGPAWTARWWLGAVCAFLAIFSMGSGFFAAAIVLGAAGVDAVRFRAGRERAATLGAMVVVIAAGLALHVNYPAHEPLKAHTLHDFFLSFWRACQWPTREFVLFGVVSWVPWIWLVARVWRAGRAADQRERVVAAAGAWVLLQYLAAAYARGAGAEWPANRYMDTEAVGLLVNFAAILIFLVASVRRVAFFSGLAFGALWVGLLAHGLQIHLRQSTSDLKVIGEEMRRNEFITRVYLASSDRALLQNQPILPYPSADGFGQRIDPPVIRALMPVSVRVPLTLNSATRGGNFFYHDFTLHPQPPLAAPKQADERDGASPATPRLDYCTTWGSFGAKTASEWESEPIALPHGGWLKFEMAGDTDAPGVSLLLLDARTRRPIAEVRPTKAAHDSWRAAYVRAPERQFVVAARVTDPAQWLAFSQPTEMPVLSHAVWVFTRNGEWVLWSSAAAVVLLAIASWFFRPREI